MSWAHILSKQFPIHRNAQLVLNSLLNWPKFLGTLAISLGSRGASLFYSFYGLLLMKSKEFSFSLKIRIATNDYSPFFLLWSLFVYMPKWIFATSAQCTHWSFVHWIIFMHLLYLVRGVVVGLSCWVSSPLFACIYASNQVGFHDAIVLYLLFKPCICNQKWNWIC